MPIRPTPTAAPSPPDRTDRPRHLAHRSRPTANPTTTPAAGSGSGGWSDVRQAYRAWPRWARMGLPVAASLFTLGLISAFAGQPAGGDRADLALLDPSTTTRAPATTQRPSSTVTGPRVTTTTPPAPTTEELPPTTPAPSPSSEPPPMPLPEPVPAPGPEPAPPPSAGGCHPSYFPCVPPASDVDCTGEGDGPAWVSGPILMVGPDDYGLDPDRNGFACG